MSKSLKDYKQEELLLTEEFIDFDKLEDPVFDIGKFKCNIDSIKLKYNKKNLNKLLLRCNCNMETFLTSVLSYTLSCFVFSDYASFIKYKKTDNKIYQFPFFINCKNDFVINFIKNCDDKISKYANFKNFSIDLLTKKFNISTNTVFIYKKDLNSFNEKNIKKNIDFDYQLLFIANDNYIYCITNGKYSPKTANKILLTFEKILNEFIVKKYLSEIEFILPEDIKLFSKFNATEKELKYKDILQAFKESIEKYPDNKLVTYEGISYTYSEGAKAVSAIVDKLSENNIQVKSNIAILVQRSHWYQLCALGILTNGYAYVPIDDTYPDERIAFILKDTSASAVLVTNETLDRAKEILNENAIQTILINVDKIDYSKARDNYTYTQVNENDIACILYTSGTLGNPKGSLITRKAVINLSQEYVLASKLSQKDVYGLYSSFGFDAPLLGMYPILLVGASLHIVSNNIRLDIQKLNQHFIKHKVTHTFMTTQVAKTFLQFVSDTSIECLDIGGEASGNIHSNKLCKVYDGYGPCECLCYVTHTDIEQRINNISVGKLNINTKCYVLDSTRRRVPVGAVGELYLSGYQLANGYLNREKETKEAFLDNPFDGDKPGYERMYKTGDIVRYLPDSTLGFIGRVDSQVKIRGNRVELGEVDAVIREVKEVIDVTVQTTLNNGNKELVAYVESNDKKIKDKIIKHISSCKPSYMVPSHVIVLDKIPLNVNGKVDKRSLQNIKINSNTGQYRAPTNYLENQICKAFEKVLGVKKIGINDDFFVLGGTSLDIIKVLNIIKLDNFSIETLYMYRNPKAIADYMVKDINKYIDFKIITDKSASYKTILAKNQNTFSLHICINQQKAKLLKNNKIIKEYDILTGSYQNFTPTGIFRIDNIYKNNKIQYLSNTIETTYIYSYAKGSNLIYDDIKNKNYGLESYVESDGTFGGISLSTKSSKELSQYLKIGTNVLIYNKDASELNFYKWNLNNANFKFLKEDNVIIALAIAIKHNTDSSINPLTLFKKLNKNNYLKDNSLNLVNLFNPIFNIKYLFELKYDEKSIKGLLEENKIAIAKVRDFNDKVYYVSIRKYVNSREILVYDTENKIYLLSEYKDILKIYYFDNLSVNVNLNIPQK